ncbi:MAG: hypothetical protein FJ388_24020, partial [Verrucomicrobia bacterium]|nr:hypothetical protein [Verrucomicrobiota bacterium]
VELDVDGVSAAFRKAVAGALRAADVKATALQAIAITSQAQTFTVLDKRGRAKMRFISWQDNRAGETCATLKKTASLADFAKHCSFGEPLAALQVCQIKHLQQTRPGFIQPDDLLLKLPTYFVWRLTGEPVIDDNLAAMSGLYSLALRDWWPSALKACGIRHEQLPRVIPVGSVAAHTRLWHTSESVPQVRPASVGGVATRTTADARQFGLPEGLPVVLAGNDQTAGAYGAQLDRNNAMLLTLGTAQVAYVCLQRMPPPVCEPSCNADTPVRAVLPQHNGADRSVRVTKIAVHATAPRAALVRGPYPGGRAYRLAADSCGGNIINWAQTVLAGCDNDEKFFAQAAKSERGSRGLIFGPTLDSGKGVWRNVALHHTSADFARSVVESLSKRMAAMVKTLGVNPRRHKILAAGGGSQSALFVQTVSEMLGAP